MSTGKKCNNVIFNCHDVVPYEIVACYAEEYDSFWSQWHGFCGNGNNDLVCLLIDNLLEHYTS